MTDSLLLMLTFVVVASFGYYCGHLHGARSVDRSGKDMRLAADSLERSVMAVQELRSPPERPPSPVFASPVKLGEHFLYLGVDMLCTQHGYPHPILGNTPGIGCEYVDDGGVIRTHFIVGDAVAALATELGRDDDTLRAAESALSGEPS